MALERFLGPLAIVAACGLGYYAAVIYNDAELEPNEEEERSPCNEQPEEAARGASGTEMVDRRLQDAGPSAAQFVVGRHVKMQNHIFTMLNLIDWGIFCTHGDSNASEKQQERSFLNQLANHVTWSAASQIIPGPMMRAADLVSLWEAMQTFLEATTNGDSLQQATSGAESVMYVIHIFRHYFPLQTQADESGDALFGPAAPIIDRAGKVLLPIYHRARKILRLLNELNSLDTERENSELREKLDIAEQQLEAAELRHSDADEQLQRVNARSRGLEAKLALYELNQQQLIADKQVQDEIIQQLLSRRRACTGRRNMANTHP